VLLKATHLPFIAAIWAYEHFSGEERTSGAVSMSGPETPGAPNRRLRPSLNPRRVLTTAFAAPGEGNGLTSGRYHNTQRPQTRSGPSEPDPQLKPLVLKLTAQVEQLTAMVSQLQEREASKAA
jgi:hypothetical protein